MRRILVTTLNLFYNPYCYALARVRVKWMDYGPVPNKMDMCVLERERGRGGERVRRREGESVCENFMVVNVT